MNPEIFAYASMLMLSREDVRVLKIRDAYSLHKVVYGLFEDRRLNEEKSVVSSGILYADKGGDFHFRKLLILSDRRPHQTPQFGKVETRPVFSSFLNYEQYLFEVIVNPSKRDNRSGKIMPVTGRENVRQWFLERAGGSWGLSVSPDSLEVVNVGVQKFEKQKGQFITHGSATLKGKFHVVDRERFIKSFKNGIGRGRAFGFGLLQIDPVRTK
jgi:CRISPR system Cascade subunit CasE